MLTENQYFKHGTVFSEGLLWYSISSRTRGRINWYYIAFAPSYVLTRAESMNDLVGLLLMLNREDPVRLAHASCTPVTSEIS